MSNVTFKLTPCVLIGSSKLRRLSDYGGGKENPVGCGCTKIFNSTFEFTEFNIHKPNINLRRQSRRPIQITCQE